MAAPMADILRDLKQWSNTHGISLHPSVDIKYNESKGFHLCALESNPLDQEKGNWVASCPHAASLSVLNAVAQEDPSFPLRSNIGSVLSQKCSKTTIAHFLLIEQYLLGDKSFWAPYLKALPQPGSLSTPLYFSDDDRRWLAGTNLLKAVQLRESRWKEDCDKGIKALTEAGVDSQGYIWQVFTFLYRR
jgi:hypothetical protein